MALLPARWLSIVVSALASFALVGTAPAEAGVRTTAAEVAVEVLPQHTLFRPKDLGGVRHPVIVWGNGTFAIPLVYAGLLRHWASQGFIVAAANTPMSGSGGEMRAGIDLLAARDADPKSPYHGRVDLRRIAATGHSQGGAGAVNAAADPRVTTVVPIEPAGADVRVLRTPALFLAGQGDHIVPPADVRAMYEAAGHVPAVYGELRGAGHLTPLGDGGAFRDVATAWMRALLMDDAQARARFFGPDCGYCSDPAFSAFLRNSRT